MREHLPKFIIIFLLVAIVGLPILLRPAGGASNAPGDAVRLVIYTPHGEQIRYEIEHAYNDYRAANDLPPVLIDWRTPGGTTDIRKTILSQFKARLDTDAGLDGGIGVDLFFGGGDYDHGKVANGIQVGEDSWSPNNHRVAMDPQIDTALREAAFPSQYIGNEPLYDTRTFIEKDGDGNTREVELVAWTGVTLSSFGIVYNNDSIEQLGIERPETWRDLTNPKLRGWVALADPGHSGSIAKTLETILRREGWTEGWQTLRMVYANARYFATSSDRVPVDVSRGDAAAGFCIDFYGRYQAGAVGDQRMGYADPIEDGRSMTATTADPITLLRGAPNLEEARAFLAWLLTTEAQSLWQRSLSDEDDGLLRPDQFELRRQPIRADLYTDASRASWTDQALDPYPTAVPFPEGTPGYFSMVAPLTKAMAIDVHGELIAAWQTLARARESNHPKLAEMESLFFALPDEVTLTWPDEELSDNWQAIQRDANHPRFDDVVNTLEAFEKQLDDLGELDAKRVRWRQFFRDNYRAVVWLGRG